MKVLEKKNVITLINIPWFSWNMSSGELQGGSLCCDKRCGKLSNLGVLGCRRDYDLVCLDSLGTDILLCLPPQTTIHTSSREQQQRAESRAAQGDKSRRGWDELFIPEAKYLWTGSKHWAHAWVNCACASWVAGLNHKSGCWKHSGMVAPETYLFISLTGYKLGICT